MASENNEVLKKIFKYLNGETSEFYVKPEDFETVQLKGFNGTVKMRDGVYLENLFINLSILKNMKLRSDDVFLCGIQKSGTTWMEEIIWLLLNNLDFETSKQLPHTCRTPWIDPGHNHPKILESMKSPRVFKSHLHLKFFPENFSKTVKIVYAIRNPKDVLCSMHKFLSSLKFNEFTGSIDDMVDLFVEGKILYGPWWDHVNQYAELENVHFVHYEDLIEKPMETLKDLAKYLEVEISDEDTRRLLEFVSFSNMKEFRSADFKNDLFAKPELEFFNKGQIGNWKNQMNEEQSKRIDEVLEKNFRYKKKPIQYVPTIKKE